MRAERGHGRRASVLVGLVAAAAAACVVGASTGSVVAAAGADALARRMRLCVAQLASGLASDDPRACIGAQADLLSFQTALLETLSEHARDADLEVRVRVKDLLAKIALETRVARMVLKLPPLQRDRLRRLRLRRPELLEQMLSPDWSRRAKVLAELASSASDPEHLASPLLVMSLRHPSRLLAAAAANAAAAGDYRSDAVVDALTDLLERTWQRRSSAGYYGSYDPRRPDPHVAALNALVAIASPRAVPKLLELLMKDRSFDMRRVAAVAEAIAASGELRAIPPLLKELRRTSPQRSWWAERVRGSTTPADYALLILLRLTGQAPGNYGLLYFDYYGSPYVGFVGSADRRAAFAKFRKWWSANRNTGPYKDLKPLPRPGQGANSPAPEVGEARQAADGAGGSGPVVAADSLREEMVAEVDLLARELGSGRLRSRLRAHRDLLGMHRAYLGAIIACAERSPAEVRGQLLDVAGDAVTESRVYNARVALEKDSRDKLSRLAAGRADLLRDCFSLSWKRRVRAMEQIRIMADPDALAEPLVAMALRGSPPQLVIAAARAVESGKYHSDRIVRALADILAKTPRNAWRSEMYRPRQAGRVTVHVAALKAMAKVRNPNAAPLLLALMLDARSTEPARDAMLAEALAATGDRRVVPALLPRLDRTRIRSSVSSGTAVVTAAPCDPALMALVKLTGQDPNDYKFQKWPFRRSIYGFRDRKQRSEAIKKFKDWWAKNKTTPRYRDLEPIALPELRRK